MSGRDPSGGSPSADIEARKEGHLDLFRRTHPTHGEKTTLFEQVELVPDPLPQLSLDEVDTTVALLGHTLSAPLLLTGMTGGTPDAGAINRDLAAMAGHLGLGFGVGSQRAMLEDRRRVSSYAVRDAAGPDTLVIANVGIAQLPALSLDDARWLVESIDADALVVHLNAAQELVQPEGDRDFRGTEAALRRLVEGLDLPVLVKEVGSGIGGEAARRLVALGVAAIDVAGAGGTSWTYAEALRGQARAQRIGETFRSWGIPTAAAVLQVAGIGVPVIASGGIRTGLEVAKALCLGATACGTAGPAIRALMNEGAQAAERLLGLILEELRVAMVLTGARSLSDLPGRPRVLGPDLGAWEPK